MGWSQDETPTTKHSVKHTINIFHRIVTIQRYIFSVARYGESRFAAMEYHITSLNSYQNSQNTQKMQQSMLSNKKQ